jgi:two-component system, LuxR family, sensor kinase FixL
MCEQFRMPAWAVFPGWIHSGLGPEVIVPAKGDKVVMREWIETMRSRAAAVTLMVDARQVTAGLVYLVGYVALDRVSFSESYAQLGITPWNPSTGLSFVLVLSSGRRFVPLLFVAPFLADMVNRQGVLPWLAEILSVAAIGAGYSAALLFLTGPVARFDPRLPSMRDLAQLILATSVSAAFVAASFVGLMIAAGLLPGREFAAAAMRFWIGDIVGVLALVPFALFVLSGRRILPLSLETAMQCAAVLVALAMVFGLAEEREFQLFYVLFLPIVWMAVRNGIEGVSAGILITQIGIILGVAFVPNEREELVALQPLMLVLTVTGLIAGELVTERRRVESQMQMQRESLAGLARLGSLGELAAAVAHEVNQPLMAAGTYARLVADTVKSGGAGAAEVVEIAKKAIAQVDRAAEVIRRLRALVRLDRSNRAPVAFDRIVKETLELCRPDLERAGVVPRVALPSDLPLVAVDILQIEQVLLNLVRNSLDAIRDSGKSRGTIVIEAEPMPREADGDFVEIAVLDSGPGFSRHYIENGILPLSSSKADGLGIGLPLCKTIVEGHGGRLWLDAGSHGASVRFTLPVSKLSDHV